MKHATCVWFSIGLLALILGSAGAASAQGTPDGVTPAVEAVCSKVKGGAGYGLCVAYCEANDAIWIRARRSAPVFARTTRRSLGPARSPATGS